jgi:hypothetical protein
MFVSWVVGSDKQNETDVDYVSLPAATRKEKEPGYNILVGFCSLLRRSMDEKDSAQVSCLLRGGSLGIKNLKTGG